EQCRGAGDIDHRSDIYALGCVMFHMLTGQPPFTGQGVGDLIASHMMMTPPSVNEIVPDLPPVIDEVVAQCLQKAPEERVQRMADLERALEAAELEIFGATVPKMSA